MLVALLGSGCSTRLGDLTALSTKNLPLDAEPVRQRVEGKDCTHMALIIPLGSLTPNIEEAADQALLTAPGANALSDVALYTDPLFLLVYNRNCFRVVGDAVKVRPREEGSR